MEIGGNMFNIGDIFYDDTKYPARAEFCNENGYLIKEIEADEKGRRFQICEKPHPTQKELDLEELEKLKNWFTTEYSYKQEKLLRLIRLNKFTDDGTLPKDALMDLDYEAERKRKRIQELEKIVEE